MNPQMVVGLFMQGLGAIGMGANTVRQFRTMPPPQVQAQTQAQCPLNTKLEVVVSPNGQRTLACVQVTK